MELRTGRIREGNERGDPRVPLYDRRLFLEREREREGKRREREEKGKVKRSEELKSGMIVVNEGGS